MRADHLSLHNSSLQRRDSTFEPPNHLSGNVSIHIPNNVEGQDNGLRPYKHRPLSNHRHSRCENYRGECNKTCRQAGTASPTSSEDGPNESCLNAPSVHPNPAGPYFNKLRAFCFCQLSRQRSRESTVEPRRMMIMRRKSIF